ncbi:hypothetical protein HRG84_12835 [Flavisolibacter sp. BT320]|nr:hypothetical protein [Flavisolibacter longurius]
MILVFNFYGYRVVLAYMEKSNDRAMEQQLDEDNYSNDELISIKTPLNLPYYTSSPEYERAYGSVNIEGVVYDYVKKRVYNDTLELLCLPNSAKTKLHDIKNTITQSAADGQASLPLKKGVTTLKISLPDYCQQTEALPTFATSPYIQHHLLNETRFFSGFTSQQERPPQAMAFAS